MKKEYVKPNMLVVELQRRSCILLESQVRSVDNNADIEYAGSDEKYKDGIIK